LTGTTFDGIAAGGGGREPSFSVPFVPREDISCIDHR